MIRSMTGFGRAEVTIENTAIRLEVKAVNHRYGEVYVRMPKQLSYLEETIKSKVMSKLSRGRVEVYVNYEEMGERERDIEVDKELALAYHNSLRELANTLNIDHKLDIKDLVGLPEVLSVKEKELNLDLFQQLISQALTEALEQVECMREQEGKQLANDVENRIINIVKLLEKVELKAPEVVSNYKEKLEKRLAELLEQSVDENRLAVEVAIFADRANIDEEIVRMFSHLDQFKRSLKEKAPIGRKLDFIIQEMNREVNTIGSKSNDLDISHVVVELKSELEKVREQVQNIE